MYILFLTLHIACVSAYALLRCVHSFFTHCLRCRAFFTYMCSCLSSQLPYTLYMLSHFLYLYVYILFFALHIVHVVAYALLTCVYFSSPSHIVYVVANALLTCVCAVIALLCLFQIALLCVLLGLHCHACPPRIVILPFALSCVALRLHCFASIPHCYASSLGCIVLHPPTCVVNTLLVLFCRLHLHCYALLTCIAMHVSNNIVPVKFSFFSGSILYLRFI